MKITFKILACLLITGLALQNNTQAQFIKNLELPKFHSISLNSSYNVFVRESNKQAIKVEVDEEYWPETNVYVDDEVLYIDVKQSEDKGKTSVFAKLDKMTVRPTMNIYVTITELRNIRVNGAGKIQTENSLNAPELTLEMNGTGSMDIDIKSTNLKAGVYSSGNITLSGYCTNMDLEVFGTGQFNAYEFEARECDVTIRGTTTCEINVSDEVNARIYGPGVLKVKGDTQNLNKTIYGKGTVDRAY